MNTPPSPLDKLLKCVLTGGPGIGKTTVLNILQSMGYVVIPETARQVIESETKTGGQALPWADCALFQEKVFEFQLKAEEAHVEGTAFLDRGIIDGHGYAVHFGVKSPDGIHLHGKGRYDKVFILDQLPNYKNDTERKETPEEAAKIHQAVIDAYVRFGYEPIFVPDLGQPMDRVNFILERM